MGTPSSPRNTSISTDFRRDAARHAAAALAGDDAAAGRQISARDGGRRARSLNGALDVRAAKKTVAGVPRALAATTEDLGWRRAGRRGAARRRRLRHGVRAGTPRRGGRGRALPYAAWLGLPQRVRGARGDGARRAPAGARRPATVAFARRRGPRSQRRRLRRVAKGRAPGGRPRRRSYTRRALAANRGTTSRSRRIAPRFFPAPTRRRQPLWSALRWWERRCFCVAAAGWNWTGWNWSALERRDDVEATPQDIPHGDSFGFGAQSQQLSAPSRAIPAACTSSTRAPPPTRCLRWESVRRRVEALVRPSQMNG